MLSVDDLLKILDRIPLWKKLVNMLNKVEDLEKRVEKLEKLLQQQSSEFTEVNGLLWKKNSKFPFCPKCKTVMSKFPPSGKPLHWVCGSCGLSTAYFEFE